MTSIPASSWSARGESGHPADGHPLHRSPDARAGARQSALGEERNDPAADDRDQQYDQIDGEIQARGRTTRGDTEPIQVHERIRERQQEQDGYEGEVVPLAAAEQRHGQTRGQRGQKGDIHRRDEPAGHGAGREQCQAAGNPQRQQRAQRSAAGRRSSCAKMYFATASMRSSSIPFVSASRTGAASSRGSFSRAMASWYSIGLVM